MIAPGSYALLKQLTVLYVEDEEGIRGQVRRFLADKVGQLWCAADGDEGLALFQSHHPDLVISDIMMPGINGLQLAEAVKRFCPATPVIMATAFNEFEYLQQSIETGVDAYLLKPLNLEAMIQSLCNSGKQVLRNRELAESRLRLQEYHQAAEEERHLVAELMAAMMRPERLADPQIQFSLEPTDLVSGDMIALNRARDGRLYLMLADSTGHGLPAALNLLPLNYIFYRLSEQGLPVALLVEEMNRAIHEHSPADRFVAALVAVIDHRNRVVEVWNGGIPAALLVNENGETSHVFNPCHLPLGVVGPELTADTEIYQWREASQLVLWSDGLIEAKNEAGEPLGHERLTALLPATRPPERFQALLAAARHHRGNILPFDDCTLILTELPGN